LAQEGYQQRGNEVLYNGFTGRKLEAQIFIGPTYYQRLKHMVDDKIHSRAHGPLQVRTRAVGRRGWTRGVLTRALVCACTDLDAPARGGSCARRWSAVRRDGA
jgi:hypothetical protein